MCVCGWGLFFNSPQRLPWTTGPTTGSLFLIVVWFPCVSNEQVEAPLNPTGTMRVTCVLPYKWLKYIHIEMSVLISYFVTLLVKVLYRHPASWPACVKRLSPRYRPKGSFTVVWAARSCVSFNTGWTAERTAVIHGVPSACQMKFEVSSGCRMWY